MLSTVPNGGGVWALKNGVNPATSVNRDNTGKKLDMMMIFQYFETIFSNFSYSKVIFTLNGNLNKIYIFGMQHNIKIGYIFSLKVLPQYTKIYSTFT